MQREQTRRGFSISHQKVVLEIDFSGVLWGYTEITIVPTSRDLQTIHLHSRQCTIHSVTVASQPAEFVHHDPLASLNVSNPADCHTYPELKRKLYSALAEGDEGELSIAIPKGVALKQSGHAFASSIHSEAATPEPQTPGPSLHTPGLPEFLPIAVIITYSLRNPVDGFQFVLPTDSYPYRVPHAYTTPTSPDAARCWVPCVDNLFEKCTWEFEFVVPKYLEEPETTVNEDGELEEAKDASPTVVVCSGDLMEQVAHPFNSNRTIFLFTQTVLTSVQQIAFAAGPFHVHPIPTDAGLIDDPTGSSQPLMHAFCLPGHEAMLHASTAFLRSAMTFYTTDFGSYPFGSYKLVVVDEMPTQRFDSATLCLITVDILHGADAIEQVFETRHVLSHALACQWMGINIQPKTWSDTWLVNGLGLYIAGLFLRKLQGNNEYRFRLKRDMQRVVEWDNGSMPPICQPQQLDPPDAATLPFVNLKAPLVLHILDRRLGKSGTSLGLSRVLPKLFLSALSGEMPNNGLSTHAFLRTCRKVSGVDPRSFAEQWIYGSGCPAFGFSASFNRKKMAVEITMRQEAPAHKALEGADELRRATMKPVPFFEGTMTIRIHEADGTPYEHVLDIRNSFKRYEVPFNTKYKRVRRNTKRYLARQAAAQAAAEGDTEAAEAMGMVDMGFGLEVWEKEQERENWKVADWTEEEEQTMSGATYEWIRMDADFEWIAAVAFDQPDFMWVSQLQRDRDVVAQLEAVDALSKMSTAIVSSTFTKTVLVSNYYYRIRCEAALALVHCAIRRLDFIGLFHLFKLFLKHCYEPEDPNQDLFSHTYVPKPNDFSDLSEYFVRKSLINAISRVRFENGKSPAVVRQFLIDQLRYNDNTSNPYSDAYYICTVLSALACATVSTVPPERGELMPTESHNEQNAEDANLLKSAIAEVDRYRSMDRLIPSPHNVVTIAALEFYLVLTLASLVPSNPRVFFPLTRDGNYAQVRIAAFDGLFLTKWYTAPIMRYIFAVMSNDSSRIVRRHVARSACQSLAILATMGEMKASSKEQETLLIEDDGTQQEKAKEAKKTEVESMIKVLRKDKEVGKSETLREFLMPIALAPDLDQEVRWSIIKLADILIKGAEEEPPKVTIHLPPTPVQEMTPTLPLVKVAKPNRPPKVGLPIPPKGSPLVPFTPPAKPKLKIPRASSVSDAHIRTPVTEQPSATPRTVAFAPPGPPKLKGRPPKDKAVHVPKAQSSGMPVNDLRACRSALQKLMLHKNAALFLQPVDPVRDHAPNYFEIVKNPMDLSTMSEKLKAGMYKDRFAFEADFNLMTNNCKQYNVVGSYAHNEAVALRSFFEKQWSRINKTLEAAQKSHQTAAEDTPARAMPPPPAPTPVAKPPKPHPTPASEVPAIMIRPTIKLKHNASAAAAKAPETSKVVETSKPAETPKSALKPKIRKPKAVDAPPPPYVDDGSHDILQEVIAIEQEKRHRSEKDRPPEKRKRPSPEDEDDILSSVLPLSSKKKSTVSTSTALPEKSTASKAAPSTREGASTTPSMRISLKGKEKEVLPAPKPTSVPVPASAPVPAPAPVPSRAPAAPVPAKPKKSSPPQSSPINEKKSREILKVLLRMPEAIIFSRPVNPVLDGCPTYLDEIDEPMDFGTMSDKLGSGKYSSMEKFNRDAELVFSNCRKFNPPMTYPVTCADAVEKVYKKEWAKVMEKKLSWSDKRSLQGLMVTLVKEDVSWIFREPVDPVLLGIPTYFDVIPRKDARDLRLIKHKLDNDKYDSVDAFEADIDLMVRNAVIFNGADSEVGNMAANLRNRVNELLEVRTGSKKRKDGDKGTPQPTKKVKLGV